MILNYFAIPGCRVKISNKSIERVVMAASIALNISPKKLIGTGRSRELVVARGLCYLILRRNPSFTLQEIARHFNRDHTTVMHGISGISKELSYDQELQQTLQSIQSHIYQPLNPLP